MVGDVPFLTVVNTIQYNTIKVYLSHLYNLYKYEWQILALLISHSSNVFSLKRETDQMNKWRLMGTSFSLWRIATVICHLILQFDL